jgi:flotillin
MLDMVLESLPKVAAEVAAPLSQAKKITMISDGSGEIGTAKLTSEVLSIISSVPQVFKNMTGVDITAMLARGGMGTSRVSRLNKTVKGLGMYI